MRIADRRIAPIAAAGALLVVIAALSLATAKPCSERDPGLCMRLGPDPFRAAGMP